jgi:hypothetical protein
MRAQPDERAVAAIADMLTTMTPERAAEAVTIIIDAMRRDLVGQMNWTQLDAELFALAFVGALRDRIRAVEFGEVPHSGVLH